RVGPTAKQPGRCDHDTVVERRRGGCRRRVSGRNGPAARNGVTPATASGSVLPDTGVGGYCGGRYRARPPEAPVQQIVECLAAQHAELDALLAGLTEPGWATPTRCPGWTVADVVLHLAQTDEVTVISAEQRPLQASGWMVPAGGTVDDAAGAWVAAERGRPPAEVLARWRAAAAAARAALAGCEPGTRLAWVAGPLPARPRPPTGLAESCIHPGAGADALGAPPPAGDRLWHIARLAWRTLPYAFARAGTALSGPVAVELDAPGGGRWSFGDGTAVT